MPQSKCVPRYLVPPCIERADGAGPAIDLGLLRGKLLVVTLGVNNVLEQEGLAISIWGSASGTEWGARPLASFPAKSYCGVYSTFLNLAHYPTIRYLRVEWKMSRWAKRDSTRMFGFFVSIEESISRVNAAVA
jgi:hypothetical protein